RTSRRLISREHGARSSRDSPLLVALSCLLPAPRPLLRARSGRKKNFAAIRILHRRAGRKTTHVDVTAVRRVWAGDESLFARHRRSVGQIFTFFGDRTTCSSRILLVRRFATATTAAGGGSRRGRFGGSHSLISRLSCLFRGVPMFF